MTHRQKKAAGKNPKGMSKDGNGKGCVINSKKSRDYGRQAVGENTPCRKTTKNGSRRGASDAEARVYKEDAKFWAEIEKAFVCQGGFPRYRRKWSLKKILDSFERDLNTLLDSDQKDRTGRSTGRRR